MHPGVGPPGVGFGPGPALGPGQAPGWPVPLARAGMASRLDPDELELLAAQDRRLKRLLGIAIVVLIIVLSAVVMLWLRRMGIVAF
jgi:hypothetical protein